MNEMVFRTVVCRISVDRLPVIKDRLLRYVITPECRGGVSQWVCHTHETAGEYWFVYAAHRYRVFFSLLKAAFKLLVSNF